MEAKKRHIKSGVEFERYFSKAGETNELIKRGSTLEDTVRFLPEAIHRTSKQTALIAQYLKDTSVYETCKKIWNWVYAHIDYNKDDKGKEQIRSPRRSFWDRFRGVDCDDYTVFISTILTNLNIKHILRVAKYTEENGFQHIYPVVPISKGNYIIVDCVVDNFNYEVPFIEKKDTAMDLEFLDGINNTESVNTRTIGIDAEDLTDGFMDLGDLGRRKLRDTKFGKKLNNFKNSKFVQTVKKGIHIVNRLNPGAALLRAGILAALKINMFKIAEHLRFAYLDPNTASQQNLDMSKFDRLIKVKERLEKIFYDAGGKTENFKKAILTGRGNRSKEVPVSGLGSVDYNNYTEQHSLSQILGVDSYNSEMYGIEGLGSLGEPATGAAIAAATSVLTAIAGLLKSIGSLKKGEKESDSSSDATNEATTPDAMQTIQTTSINDDANTAEIKTNSENSTTSTNDNTDGGANKSDTTETPASSETSASTSNNSAASTDVTANKARTIARETEATGFDKVKNWISENKVATGLIVASVIGLAAWGIIAHNSGKESKKNKGDLSGFPNKKSTRSKKRKKSKRKPTSIFYQKLR